MALKTVKVSDLSGTEGTDDQFASVIIRNGESKTLDVLVTELDNLKEVADLIQVEVRMSDTSTRTLMVRKADLDKWCPPEVLAKARNTRGRVPGSRLNGS